jgi:DnaJ-class molecular chaperone
MASAKIDHYAILGLDRGCTDAQIRRAYRVLAKRYHPDVNHGSAEAAERCRELNSAHEVLIDPARRRAYDRELEGTEVTPPARRVEKRERNVAQDAFVRMADFLRGTTLEVHVNDPANPRAAEAAEIYRLEIPPGTAPGTRFRLPRAEPFADGFVQIRVKPMPGGRLKVRGSDLRCDLRITARRAREGGMESVTGVTGLPVRVPIPRGVERGEVVRVPGEGLPKPRGGRGDLLVRVMYRVEVRVSRLGR